MIRQFFTLVSFILLIIACDSNEPSANSGIGENLPEDFLEFYDRFHQDADFQLEHIEFPLPGLPAYADIDSLQNRPFFWEKEDWVIHRAMDEESSGFRREIFMMGETLVIEYMKNNYNYRIQRRFSKRNGTWKLSYYEDVNQLKERN